MTTKNINLQIAEFLEANESNEVYTSLCSCGAITMSFYQVNNTEISFLQSNAPFIKPTNDIVGHNCNHCTNESGIDAPVLDCIDFAYDGTHTSLEGHEIEDLVTFLEDRGILEDANEDDVEQMILDVIEDAKETTELILPYGDHGTLYITVKFD